MKFVDDDDDDTVFVCCRSSSNFIVFNDSCVVHKSCMFKEAVDYCVDCFKRPVHCQSSTSSIIRIDDSHTLIGKCTYNV